MTVSASSDSRNAAYWLTSSAVFSLSRSITVRWRTLVISSNGIGVLLRAKKLANLELKRAAVIPKNLDDFLHVTPPAPALNVDDKIHRFADLGFHILVGGLLMAS